MNAFKRCGPLPFIAVAILMVPSASFGALTLEVSDLVTYQQTTNDPCVIGDDSCEQPAGWSFSQYSGTPGTQGSSVDLFSPAPTNTGSLTCGNGSGSGIGQAGNGCIAAEYTVFEITSIVGSSPNVGIDINSAKGQGPEVLVFFKTYRNDVVDYDNSYLGPNASIVNRNRHGYSDAVLRTIHFGSYASTDRIK